MAHPEIISVTIIQNNDIAGFWQNIENTLQMPMIAFKRYHALLLLHAGFL